MSIAELSQHSNYDQPSKRSVITKPDGVKEEIVILSDSDMLQN